MTRRAAAPVEVNEELEALKRTVITTAKRYARQHNWCAVVNTALREMGLDPDSVQEFWIEVKTESWMEWYHDSTLGRFFELDAAKAEYEELLKAAFNTALRLAGKSAKLDIDPRDKTEEQITVEIQEKAAEIATKLAAIKQPAYPKYRVRTVVNGRESTAWPEPRRRTPTTTNTTPARRRAS